MLPGAEGIADEKIVWTESITSKPGLIFLMWSRMRSSEVSLSTSKFGASMSSRSARILICRGERLDIDAPNLLVLSETSLERILDHIKKIKPGLLVIDSVQTIFSSAIPSAPGSITQVREASGSIIVLAKKTRLTTFLIGHVTTDGAI